MAAYTTPAARPGCQYKRVNGDPRIMHFHGDDAVPGPGYPAPYNRKLVETGILQGSKQVPVMVTVRPIGPRTIAGFAGTAYEELRNGQTGFIAPGKVPTPLDVHTTVVFQDGTYQPLLWESTVPNGKYGTLVQRQVLLSRETTSTAVRRAADQPWLRAHAQQVAGQGQGSQEEAPPQAVVRCR